MQYKVFYKKPCFWIFQFFFEPRLIISPSKWHFLTKVIFSTDPVSDWLENTNNKNLGEIRCCTHFFIRTNFLYFHTFFKVRLIISHPKLHFLTKIFFSTDPVSDWLENTNNKKPEEIRCCTHFFIRNNFLYFCTFFKLRLIISPSKLHFLTQFIFLHWPSIRLIGKYQQKSSCGNKVLYTIFYKKLFPVFRRESSFWFFLHICSISAKTTENLGMRHYIL